MKRKLIYRVIITPDGTKLVSRHVHDYVSYVDSVSGEEYILDGGLEYCRTSVNEVKAELIEIYEDDEIEVIREHFERGTFDENGARIYKLLKDLDTSHLENILLYNSEVFSKEKAKEVNQIYKRELEYRLSAKKQII